MGVASYLLLIFGVLWLSQMVGTYYQMRHYRRVLGRITGERRVGYVGVGNAKSRLGKGVILILVSGEDGRVVKALRMRGMTVFARFEEAARLEGSSIDDLRQPEGEGPYEAATMLAARRAVEQIDRIRAGQQEGVEVG